MADQSSQYDIRSIDIDKAAKGFADEDLHRIKNWLRQAKTQSREIRWYQKTSGYIDTTDTTGITATGILTVEKAIPQVAEQSWTRKTAYAQHFMLDSPWFSEQDIMDNDVDLLLTNVRDLTRGVQHQEDVRAWNVLSENQSASLLNTVAITNEWDDYTNATPVADVDSAKGKIRSYGYNPNKAILLLNDNEHSYLLNWIISQKGSYMPQFASSLVQGGVIEKFMGLQVEVDLNVTADYAMIFIPGLTAAWKELIPITAVTMSEPGFGKKIRVWTDGEAILEHPKSGCLLSNVGPS